MSKSKRLTDISVRNLKPRKTAYAVPDGGCVGLYASVQPSARKSWFTMYRIDGKQAKLGLGRFPDVSLATARKLAIDARESAAKGIDPSEARQAKKIAAAVAAEDTVASVCEACIKFKGSELRTADQQRAILERLVYPTELGRKPIRDVKRDDIFALLDKIKARGHGRMADVVLMLLRRSFNWYALRKSDFNSPIVRSMGLQYYNAKKHRGKRTLTDDEIRAVWKATEDDAPFSAFVRFLLITSARRNEAAGMRWREVDESGIWVLPASRSKTNEEVVRPLSKMALAILEERPRVADCPWPFTTTGLGPLNSFSQPMARLREKSGTSGWRLHDLRRTARSLLSRAGVLPDICEWCLGHLLPPMRATYDHYRPIDEMRDAFERLAALIERIVHPPEGTVIDLQERAARR
jgi:integrase